MGSPRTGRRGSLPALRRTFRRRELVARPPEPAADNLLAKKLRHERSQADDVGDGVAVPALGQHADADDAANVSSGRMQRPAELAGELIEPLRIDGSSLRVARPVELSDRVEGEPHPA